MLTTLALAAVLLAEAVAAQTPEETSSISAELWMSKCRAVADAKILPNGQVQITDSLESGQCLGALEAIGILFSMQDGGRPVLGVCQPKDSTFTQRAAIFIDYLKRHPKRYGEPFAVVMVAAFQEAYPCAKLGR